MMISTAMGVIVQNTPTVTMLKLLADLLISETTYPGSRFCCFL